MPAAGICRLLPTRSGDCNAYDVRKRTLPPCRQPANHITCVILGRWRNQLSARPHSGEKAPACSVAALVEAARSLALDSGVASVTLTDVASRAGVHHSAVLRYFTSHKEMLLQLAAEGWVQW